MEMILLNVVVGVGVAQSTLLSPVNLLTPLTASSTTAAVSNDSAAAAAKPMPNYTNVRAFIRSKSSVNMI